MAKRKASATERRAAQRAPYDKVLIVCEGSKTEPNYFRDLIKLHDISSVNVRISGDYAYLRGGIWDGIGASRSAI